MRAVLAALIIADCTYGASAFDFFRRPQDTTQLSGYWTVARGVAGILDNTRFAGISGHPVAVYSTQVSPGNDQWSQAIPAQAGGPAVRMAGGGTPRWYDLVGGSGNSGVQLRICTNGSCTNLATSATNILDTDVMRLTAVGSTLTGTVYSGWDYSTVKVSISATDSTYASGSVGVVAISAYSRGASMWAGGDIADLPSSQPNVTRSEYYVSPTGTIAGTGTYQNPWNALVVTANPSWVQAGKTVWMLPGTYTLDWKITSEPYLLPLSMAGSSGSPITWRGYPSATPAVITLTDDSACRDNSVVGLTADYLFLRDVVVQDKNDGCRVIENSGSNPPNRPGNGISVTASHGGMINSIVRKSGDCFQANTGSLVGIQVVGSVFERCGWDSPNRPHGSATYWRNYDENDPLISDGNVSRDHHYQGIRVTGGSGYVDGVLVKGTINIGVGEPVFGTGNSGTAYSNWVIENNLLPVLGGQDRVPTPNPIVRNNLFYGGTFSLEMFGRNQGYNSYDPSAPGPTITFIGNKVAAAGSGKRALVVNLPTNRTLDFHDNQYYAYGSPAFSNVFTIRTSSTTDYASLATWQAVVGDANSTLSTSAPASNWVMNSGANPYESGRCHVAIYNWSGGTTQNFDPALCGLSSGDPYEIHDIWALSGGAFATGTYSGSPISLPTNRTAYDDPTPSPLNGWGTQCWNTGADCVAALGWQSGTAVPTGSCTPGYTGASLYLKTDANVQYYCNSAGSWQTDGQGVSTHAVPTYARHPSIHAFVIRRRRTMKTVTLGLRNSIPNSASVRVTLGLSPSRLDWPSESVTCGENTNCTVSILTHLVGKMYYRWSYLDSNGAVLAQSDVQALTVN